jgi:hypothetical protein
MHCLCADFTNGIFNGVVVTYLIDDRVILNVAVILSPLSGNESCYSKLSPLMSAMENQPGSRSIDSYVDSPPPYRPVSISL